MTIADLQVKKSNGYSKQDRIDSNQLMSQHYGFFCDIARRIRRTVSAGETLRTSALVHDAWVKISAMDQFTNEQHFERCMILTMRHVLVDYARSKLTGKRFAPGGLVEFDETRDSNPASEPELANVIAIGQAMAALAKINPRQEQVVDCRFFMGASQAETAKLLGITERTVRRDWDNAREFFKAALVD